MEKEKRLIDANALTVPERKETGDPFIDGFQQGKIDAIIEVRTLAPTVDAVEVVQCKDCFADGCCSVQIDLDMGGDGYCSKGKGKLTMCNNCIHQPVCGKENAYEEA